MDGLRLGRVEPVQIGAEAPMWDPGRQQKRHDGYGRRPSARKRLVAAVAPGHDPDHVEVEYEVDAEGVLTMVTVRDRLSGAIIRRVRAGDLAGLGETSAPGMLIERRG